ncbi:recombinase family protein [Luminiphilus sp.]|nr:recombinase family protein [Luminiphilus sp.]
MKYGYARVSTKDQDLLVQIEALKKAGVSEECIRSEKVSGTLRKGQSELETVLQFLREGDELVVTRIDRLARSMMDLQNISATLKEKGVSLKATEQAVDTSTSAGKAFFDMLGVFAEFETNLRRERQMEGIARAQAEGKYRGRKKSVDVTKVRELRDCGLGATEIARELNIGRASVYRCLEQAASSQL